MIWSVVQQVGGQVTTMVVFFALAALLPPTDFGLLGMAGAWLAVLNAVCETGFGAALIHRDDLRRDHLSSAFGINIAVGAVFTLLGVALSWPAATYFRTPALQPVMAVLSLGFAVRAFGLTQMALAQRELRFRALALRDLLSSVVGGSVGLGLAIVGYGVWSLVGMSLVSALIGTIMLWRVAHWRPRIAEFSRRAAAELWPYSSRVLGFTLFKAIGQNTDRLIIGPLLGVHALGIYTFASKAVIFPVTMFVGALGAYLFPRVARLQHDRPAVRAVYRAVLMAVLNVVLPGLATIVVLAPAVVPLLGDRWGEAAPVIQILAAAALTQAIFAPVGQLMKGFGRPGWLTAWSVGFTLLTGLALWVGTAWGLVGASVGYVAAHVAALPVILWVAWRLTGLGPIELAGILWLPAVSSAVLAGGLALAARYTGAWSRPALGVAALLAGVIYLAALARLNPEFAALVVKELQKLRGGTKQPAAVASAPPQG
jgi:O-antigen/teichoic acid export membrane protein